MENRTLSQQEKQVWHNFTRDIVTTSPSLAIVDESVTPAIEIRGDTPAASPIYRKPTADDLHPGDTSQISGTSLKQIKRDRPDATLDLHGYTQEQAVELFQQFISQSSDNGRRLLRVITGYGKMTGGQGVLRAALPKWVNYPENRRLILSYQQAKAHDGGAGAWLLLLKRKERL